MAALGKIKFLWDSTGTVTQLIDKWSPRKCRYEKDYEQSLSRFLNKEIPDIKVTPQYAIGRTKADLLIGEKVIVEIKKYLMSTAQYDRLVGQLTRYKDWNGSVVILLVGKTDPDLKKDLTKFINHNTPIFSDFVIKEK